MFCDCICVDPNCNRGALSVSLILLMLIIGLLMGHLECITPLVLRGTSKVSEIVFQIQGI